MFDKLRTLLKSNSSSDIAEALAAIDVPNLETVLEDAQKRRVDLLLTGSNAEILAAEAAIDKARIDLDRAVAAVAELTRRLETAKSKEATAAFEARYQAALTARNAAIARIRGDYPGLARKLHELAEIEQNADEAIACINHELSEAAGALEQPTLRSVSHDFWHKDYVEQPTLAESLSLPPLDDLPAWGKALGWLTRSKAFAVFGIGGPVDDGTPKHSFY